jgi:hypothetical protein
MEGLQYARPAGRRLCSQARTEGYLTALAPSSPTSGGRRCYREKEGASDRIAVKRVPRSQTQVVGSYTVTTAPLRGTTERRSTGRPLDWKASIDWVACRNPTAKSSAETETLSRKGLAVRGSNRTV